MAGQDDLLLALLNKVEGILNGNDSTSPANSDSYIAWCQPGIPFQPEDLQFAVKGITGKDGDETKDLVRTAAEFSRVVNSVPSGHLVEDGIFNQNGTIVWDIYNKVMNFSQVSDSELTEKEKAKIEKFRNLMVVMVKKTDIITDEVTEVPEDGPIIKAYKTKKAAYDDASLEYNAKRLAALNSDNSLAVQDFTLNANIYRSKVKAALGEWVTNGYKEDVEKINAYIEQVSQKSMTLLKADLQDKFTKGVMTDPNSGGDFYLSSFYPGNFVNSDKGWTKISFNSSSKSTYSKKTSSATSAGVKLRWGLWSAGGSGGSSKDTTVDKINSSDFEIEFSIAQVTIGRPWMSPDFLTNTAWRWDPKMGQQELSDGKNPADGQMASYPTTAVFVKDIKITSGNMSDMKSTIDKSVSGGGSVGWGPFSIGGKHSSSSNEKSSDYDIEGNTLTVKGMQMIALKSFPLPKSPNPSDQITKWI